MKRIGAVAGIAIVTPSAVNVQSDSFSLADLPLPGSGTDIVSFVGGRMDSLKLFS